MAEEKKAARAKSGPAAKKEPKGTQTEAITPEAVKKAKKAELVEYCETLGLDGEGKVDELRGRLLEHIEKHPPKAAKREKAKGKEEGAEEVEIEEEGAYVPKKKAALPEDVRKAFILRKKQKAKQPTFLRQEWFRYKRLGRKWRKPKGGQSALRRHFGYRIDVVSIGYRGPVLSRGLHPSGFKEVLVHSPSQLEGLNPATEAVMIGHAVGMRKRKLIEEAAAEKGLRVLNRSGKSGSE